MLAIFIMEFGGKKTQDITEIGQQLTKINKSITKELSQTVQAAASVLYVGQYLTLCPAEPGGPVLPGRPGNPGTPSVPGAPYPNNVQTQQKYKKQTNKVCKQMPAQSVFLFHFFLFGGARATTLEPNNTKQSL